MSDPFESVPAIVPREALAYLNDASELLGGALPFGVFLPKGTSTRPSNWATSADSLAMCVSGLKRLSER